MVETELIKRVDGIMLKVHVQSSKQNYYAQKYGIETTYMQQCVFFVKCGGELENIFNII